MAVLEADEIFYTEFEPKMSNRFVFRVEGIPTFLIRQADRPSFSFGEVELPHINITRKVKGKVNHDTVSLTLYDPISPTGSQIVMEWIRQHHESVTGRDGYADLYKKDVTYNSLDPVGAEIEQWTLKGAFVTDVDFSGGDWSDGDSVKTIDLTLAYSYPVQEY